MTWKIVWTDNAMSGVHAVAAFQNEREPGRGAQLINAIFNRVAALQDFPESAPQHREAADSRVRKLVSETHIIVYRLIAEKSVLQVLAVRHHRQRPVSPSSLPGADR